MKAIFKDKKKLVLNSADSNEELVLAEFIKKANNGAFDIVYTKLLNINGDVDGMSIELKKKDTEDEDDSELSTLTNSEEE